jgi:signal transduction histidine kinase
MKRLFLIFLILTNILFANINLTQKEKDYLKEKVVIKVHNESTWAPFNFNENGIAKGFSIDYIKLLAKKLNLKVEIVSGYSWAEYMKMIHTDKLDIIINIAKSEEREKSIAFTDSFFTIQNAIYSNKQYLNIKTIKDLEGKTIAMPKGFVTQVFLEKNYPKIKQVLLNETLPTLQMVSEGKVHATVGEKVVMDYMINKYKLKNILPNKVINNKDMINLLHLGVSKKDLILRNILEKAQNQVTEQEMIKLKQKWFINENKTEINYELIGKIIIFFGTGFITIFFFLLREKKLKKEIEELNKNLEIKVKKEVFKNIKKDKQLQQQAKQAQMGEMLSMIAHQWRQPLGAISSTIIAIQFKLQSGKLDLSIQEDREKLIQFLNKNTDDISDYVHFLSTTIDDFRNMFKPNKSTENTNINDPITKALKIIEPSLKTKDIEITLNLDIQNNVSIYQNEIMQVILNILKNSEDNFIEKDIKDRKIVIKTHENDSFSIISIIDNGGGIDDNIVDKIFDPYFSTKNEKNGTGLGLYMCKIIIEEHNSGEFNMINMDNGVCFEIKLKKVKDNG